MSIRDGIEAGNELQTPSVAAKALRKLRVARHLSILSLAGDAEMSPANLSRIETGLNKQPEASTLEKIRVALNAELELLYADWTPILNGFGYKSNSGLPSLADVKHAIGSWAEPLERFLLPAYLVDHAHRVHDWNDLALKLLRVGRDSDDLKEITLFDLAFSTKFQRNFQIVERDDFILHMVTRLKSELVPFLAEGWCVQRIDEGKAKYPEMKRVWDSVPDDLPLSSVRTMGPLRLLFGELGQVQFDLVGTPLETDTRFRVIQYVPSNEETFQKCFAYFSSTTI